MILRLSTAAAMMVCLIVCGPTYAEPPKTRLLARKHFDIQAADPLLAKATENILIEARLKAQMMLSDTVDSRISVHIAESREQFDKLTRGGLPDWGVGCAIPTKNMIVIISPTAAEYRQPYKEIVRHEWAHIALRHRLGNSYLPRFLDEGFAMHFANQWNNSFAVTLAKAQVFGSIFTLQSIDRVNFFNASQAQIAYAQSHHAVAYFLSEYGSESFQILLDGLREGIPLDRAFEAAIGASFGTFQREYDLHVKDNYSWLLILSDMWLIWIGLALLIIVGYLLKKKRARDTYKRWEEEEKYESTDFDYEEGDPWD